VSSLSEPGAQRPGSARILTTRGPTVKLFTGTAGVSPAFRDRRAQRVQSKRRQVGEQFKPDADLLAPHRRRLEADHRPELKEKVSAFLAALFTGSDTSAFVTPGLLNHIPAVPKSPANQMLPPAPDVTFIASEDIQQRCIERYGTKLAEARYYKANFDGQNVYLTFYLAADGSIADYFAY
jgi:hypothetical protein